MPNNIFIPPVNPYRFVKLGQQRPLVGHQWQFDEGMYYESLLPFYKKVPYINPVEYNDPVTIQFHHNYDNGVEIVVLDCMGSEVFTFPALVTNVYPGNVYNNHGNGPDEQLITITASTLAQELFPYGDQTYYILIKCFLDDTLEIYDGYISEPLRFYKIPNTDTMLLRYSNSTNDFGVFFAGILPVEFHLRVNGYVDDYNYNSNDTNYEDQTANERLLKSDPYRIFKLYAGGYTGIPDYIADRVGRIFSCDITYINGKRFVKNAGAKMDKDTVDQYPLYCATLEIREYYNEDAGLFALNKIVLWNRQSFPYMIDLVQITETVPLTVSELTMINDVTEEDNLIDYMNLAGFPGIFEREGTLITFTGHEGRAFYTSTSLVYFKYLKYATNGRVGPFNYQYTVGRHVTRWADGAIQRINPAAGDTSLKTVGHVYLTTPNIDMYIFHNDNMKVLEINYRGLHKLINIYNTSLMPIGMTQYAMTNQNIAALDLAFLAPAIQTLAFFGIGYSNVTKVDYSVFTGNDWSSSPLVIFILSNNTLGLTAVDSCFNSIYSAIPTIAGGTISTINQTPPQAPSAASAAARSAMAANGVTILTD